KRNCSSRPMGRILDVAGPSGEAPRAREPAAVPHAGVSAGRAPDPQRNGHDPELCLASSVLQWPEVIGAPRLPGGAFRNHEARAVWLAVQAGLRWPDDLVEFEQTTRLSRGRLIELGTLVPTELGAIGYLREVEAAWRLGELRRLGLEMSETEEPDP